MTYFEALKKYEEIKHEILLKELRISELTQTGGLPRKNDTNMPKGTAISFPVENYVFALVELKNETAALHTELVLQLKEIDKCLLILDCKSRVIVEQKDILNLSFDEIADKQMYSVTYVKRLYYDALKILEQSVYEIVLNSTK